MTLHHAFLLLGSNVDRESNIPEAIARLKGAMDVVAVSSIYETEPVGDPNQDTFWNVAVIARTGRDVQALKTEVLRPIENDMRRVRSDNPNAARTIDIDIIVFDDAVLDQDLYRYAHLAVPMAEIAVAYSPHIQQTLQSVLLTLSQQELGGVGSVALL
jgi:2-amino-4-hydroxy-6-hydroxymethyldihydropteridine diphosphokinase